MTKRQPYKIQNAVVWIQSDWSDRDKKIIHLKNRLDKVFLVLNYLLNR